MMSLPNLAPTDSHALWYTSTHSSPSLETPTNTTSAAQGQSQNQSQPLQHPPRRPQPNVRTPLVRLRLDEEYIHLRKLNIQNYGNNWIKPPGVPKSLYQLREERRELEEHVEAMRREARAQELAEVEAQAQEGLAGGLEMRDGDGDAEGQVDLDDEVPEAEDADMGDESEEESRSAAVESGSEGDENDNTDTPAASQPVGGEQVSRSILAPRMPEDVYRQAIVRGTEARGVEFGNADGDVTDEEDREEMLNEEDLIRERFNAVAMGLGMDLDAEIPNADVDEYEHTDTDVDIESIEEENSSPMGGDGGPRRSMVRSDGTQHSLDMSGRVAVYSSSQLGSPRRESARRVRRGQ